jgi:hypothetical protein
MGLGLALSLAVGMGCGKSSGGGRIDLSEQSYDFGQVPLGELREHAFLVRNIGTGPLELQESAKVVATEGC